MTLLYFCNECLCHVDIDECAATPSPCRHICTNNEASYRCSCNIGYELNPDGHTCDGIDIVLLCIRI